MSQHAKEWRHHRAPSLREFEKTAWDVYRSLPGTFREAVGDLAIRIEDFPDDETLDAMGLESPFDLLGLYHGVDLTRQSSFDIRTSPNMVFLYRRPILDYWAEHQDSLGEIIAHVLIHEIGHHFGLSDEDMEAIEARGGEQTN